MKCSLLTLSCYLDGELPPARKGELEAHLVGCHRCRAGLGHLREEVERIQGLARVHVREGSVRALLEQTGLIAAGAPMPAVADAGAVGEPSPSTPPWLRGGAGLALPWVSNRPAAPAPGRSAPAAPVPRPGGPVAVPPPSPTAAPDTFDTWAAARGGTPREPRLEPPPPARPAADAARAAEARAGPTASPAPPESRAPRRRDGAAGPSRGGAEDERPDADRSSASDAGPPDAERSSAAERPPPVETAAATVPPAGGDAVPAWTPESSAETPVPRYPLTDDDTLDQPTAVERFGPLPASRPSLVDRLREKVALRRALRVAALDEREDGVEIVSGPGPGGPARGSRSRADLARRRSEALRPATGPGSAAAGDDGSPAQVPALDDEAPPPPRGSASGLGAGPRSAPRPVAEEGTGEERPARSVGPGRARARGPASEEAPVAAETGARTVDGRRLSAVLGAAIVLMFIVGVASARSTTPLPVTSERPTATPAPQRQVVVPPPAQASASPVQPSHPAQPQPSARPTPPAPAPPPAAGLPALTGAVTVGQGAPGWSVQDIRYGAHPGYLRMVFDLVPATGTASGSPRVTIGWQDPTTLLVSLDQVTARSAPAAPLGGGVVSSVSLLQPPPAAGSVAYVVKLSRPVQFTPAFASSPLRLIVDLR